VFCGNTYPGHSIEIRPKITPDTLRRVTVETTDDGLDWLARR
jgi:hypothetical protein